MYEYYADLISKIDILGTGAIIPLLGLAIGISIALSNNNLRNFIINLLIINFIMATIIFVLTDTLVYFIVFGITLLLYLFLPENSLNYLIGRKQL